MTINDRISSQIKDNKIVLYMKGTSMLRCVVFQLLLFRYSRHVGSRMLPQLNVLEDDEIRQGIKDFSNWPTIPQLYVGGEFVGGADILKEMYQAGELQNFLNNFF